MGQERPSALSATIMRIAVQTEEFDANAESAALTKNRYDIGALVTFEGLCRDEGGALSALELEHYPGMAEDEIHRMAQEAADRWPLLGIVAIHRYGKIAPGEKIVLVMTAASHRAAAFAAAEFLMDYLKTHAPFWKKEHHKDGAISAWVEARDADDSAARRWSLNKI